jgi:hypothetical protein
MKITKEWLEEKNTEEGITEEGIIWFSEQKETDSIKLVKKLQKEKRYKWSFWLLTQLLQVQEIKRVRIAKIALFVAKKVLHIFENVVPDDWRPRKAIELLEKYLQNPTADDAFDAAIASIDAYDAAAAAAVNDDVAAAAANAAAAAIVTYAAIDAYYAIINATKAVAAEEKEAFQNEIIEYGIELLQQK